MAFSFGGKKRQKIAIFFVVLFLVIVIFLIILKSVSPYPLSSEIYNLLQISSVNQDGSPKDKGRYKQGPIDKAIVDDLSDVGLSNPLLSWNDKMYGRIYASICDAPTEQMYNCDRCLDGGVGFYDWQGEFITGCNGGWSRDGDECAYLRNLKYSDADYVSEECPWNKANP